MRPLEEQTILVTGSTDGLGRRLAGALGERGASGAFVADLASLDEVRRLAAEVEQVDALVNNAGLGMVEPGMQSAERYQLTFAVNHLSHFLLTQLLLPKLREPGRVVNVASVGQAPLDFDDLMLDHGYEPFRAYAQGPASLMSSVEEGVEATLRLVADPSLDGVSGRFFDGARDSRAHAQAYDADARRSLWDESERLTGLS